MKKILLGLMVASLLTTTGCDSSKTVIGILQTADHSALDLAREGFISVLENSKELLWVCCYGRVPMANEPIKKKIKTGISKNI